MKEFVDWRARPASPLNLSADALSQFDAFADRVAQRSQIVWGEHCSECAFPTCYSSCAYYTPRDDFHCRRFERGLESIREGARTFTRIRFRKWGKLEGHGPRGLVSPEQATQREALQVGASGLLRLLPDQRIAAGAARRLTQMARAATAPMPLKDADAMVVETWLADAAEIPFTLTIVPVAKDSAGLFQGRFVVRKGYARAEFPMKHIASTVDLSAPFLVQIEPLAEAPPHDIVFGLVDFVSIEARAVVAASPMLGDVKLAKCVVWDLDNTVWRGTLAEDGVEGLVLNDEAVAAIKELDARGILNSIASKNDEGPALQALAQFGLREYFLFPQVGWGPKSDSVRAIAGLLDIGADTFIFIDDQAFERGEVSAALPEVRTLTDADIPNLLQRAEFDVPATAESAKRRLMYQDEERRHAAFSSTGTDYMAFLRSCGIVLEISRPSQKDAERLFELSQRTNQLNFSASRLTRAEVDDLATAVHPLEGYVLRCFDAFGDYGIVGLVLVDRSAAAIEAFYMSCRVQRKRVEQAFFEFLRERLTGSGDMALRARFKRSAKNGASLRMLEDLGFRAAGDSVGAEGYFERPLSETFDAERIVRVVDRTMLAEAAA